MGWPVSKGENVKTAEVHITFGGLQYKTAKKCGRARRGNRLFFFFFLMLEDTGASVYVDEKTK